MQSMKIISLNIFGGQFLEPLLDFIRTEAPTTDVFCFQEMLTSSEPARVSNGSYTQIFTAISNILSDFQPFFAAAQEQYDLTTLVDFEVTEGVATFVKKTISVIRSGDFFIHQGFNTLTPPADWSTLGANAQYISLAGERPLTIFNVHGTAWPGNKLDTPSRLIQSHKIIDHIKKSPGEIVVMGDFNLLPDTKSIRLFEDFGLTNLIKTHNIKNTRGSLLRKLHPEYAFTDQGFQDFADYTFISPGINVVAFTVPDMPISDHLPMILEF